MRADLLFAILALGLGSVAGAGYYSGLRVGFDSSAVVPVPRFYYVRPVGSGSSFTFGPVPARYSFDPGIVGGRSDFVGVSAVDQNFVFMEGTTLAFGPVFKSAADAVATPIPPLPASADVACFLYE